MSTPAREPCDQETPKHGNAKRTSKRRPSWIQRASQTLTASLNTDHVKPAKSDEAKRALERHDCLNLVFLPVIVVCIFLNLDFVTQPWTRFWYKGDHFWLLFNMTLAYFVVDTLWILFDPICVKSPPLIIVHHAVTMLYILIPFFIEEMRWFMCALLIVEMNTFFLIARRYHNREHKQRWAEGTPVWLSLLDLFMQASFYITWVVVRCILYPLYLPLIIMTYVDYSERKGRYFNVIMICPVIQLLFVWLSYTWSVDLFCGKRKARKSVDEASSPGDTSMESSPEKDHGLARPLLLPSHGAT